MNDKILYILGNGFDCCHGLDTGVDRFKEILQTQEIYNETESAEVIFEGYGVLWGDYEACLAEIDLNMIEENQMIAPDYMSDHEYDRDGGIYNMEQYTKSLHHAVQESLSIMVEKANDELNEKKAILKDFLNSGDAVLSFNYTSTLEQLYTIPANVSICHIHGYHEYGEELLLGYSVGMSTEEFNNRYFNKDELEMLQQKIEEVESDDTLTSKEKEEELLYWNTCYDNATSGRDYYIDSQREKIFGFYQSLKKEIQIDKLRAFLNSVGEINEIVVMGHSMSQVDSDYMKLIEEMINPSEWRISQFKGEPSTACISEYSFAKKAKFYNLYNEYSKD